MWLWQCVFLHEVLCNAMHLLGGFLMLAYVLNPPCPGFVLGSWLSDANPNEKSKKILFSALVSMNGSTLVQEMEDGL